MITGAQILKQDIPDAYPLIKSLGDYETAKRIIKNAPKGATKWSKKYLKYMKASKHSYTYSHDAVRWIIENVLWQWDDEYTDHAIKLSALRKEVFAYEVEHDIYHVPTSLKSTG